MRYPANGPVTSPYGMRWHPIHKRYIFHNGTDQGWGNGGGTRIFAPMSGQVVSYRYVGGYGNQLTIRNGSITITLSHLANAHVRAGTVSEGQHIATMGNTGTSAGTHVHTEAFVNGTRVNFETLIGRPADSAGSTPIPQEEDDMFTDADRAALNNLTAILANEKNAGTTRGIKGALEVIDRRVQNVTAILATEPNAGTTRGLKGGIEQLTKLVQERPATVGDVPDADLSGLAKAVADEIDRRNRERLTK